MGIHDSIKHIMTNNKNPVEMFQWASISAVSALVYSEYISKMKNKTRPVPCVMVPEVRAVKELLKPEGDLISRLSKELIDKMNEDLLFKKYVNNMPELLLFRGEDAELLKIIFDLYISPNITRAIPETIERKFGLGDPNNRHFREDNTIYLFDKGCISDRHVRYIIDQTILQLLLLLPSIEKEVTIPENNDVILLMEDEIVTINHENAICPIHFSKTINMNNPDTLNTLEFTTSSSFKVFFDHTIQRDDVETTWALRTAVFNQVAVTRLI